MAKRVSANDRLRRAREERHWTQAEVAQAIGTSSFTVSRWELGVQTPQPYFREKLCTLYGLSLQELGLIQESLEQDPVRPVDPAEARARRDLVGQVWRYWIGTELETAVGHLPRIDLTLTERPDAVVDRVRVLPRQGAAERSAEYRLTINAAYQRAGEQLLILGDPGAGKTRLLLELTRSLLEAAPSDPSRPMPVVFHLSSWADARQPLTTWLVEELHRRYGVARWLGRKWLGEEQVLPLLDGLDEVAEEHRTACAEAVNAFHAEHGQLPLVVCCRSLEYESLGTRLELRGAVAVLPLTRTQVDDCLALAGDPLLEVRSLIQEDERLRELVTTPLFLSIIVRTYGGDGSAGPRLPGALADRRRRVLSDYVEAMLARPRATASPREYSTEHTVRWLAWLARAMRDHSEGVFHLDWMQPSWLPERAEQRLVMLLPAAIVVLAGSLAGTFDVLLTRVLLGAHTAGQVAGDAVTGVVVGVVAGLLAAVFTYERGIAPTNRLSWSWTTFRRNLPSVLTAVLGAMSISLIVDRVVSGVVSHLIYGVLLVGLFLVFNRLPRRWPLAAGLSILLAAAITSSLLAGTPAGELAYRVAARLAVGLSLGLMFGPRTPLCETVPAPGKGIDMSARHGVNAGLLSGGLAVLLFGIVAGISAGLMMGLRAGIIYGVAEGLTIGLIVGVGVGLRRGGGAWLRHALLHRLLVRSGAAPRDYVAFLEHASGLVLLRRRGSGYQFVHRLLLDHFAEQQ